MKRLFFLLLSLVSSPLFDFAYAQEKKLEPLYIGLPLVPTRIPYFVAQDIGLFEKHGLDAKLVYISGTNVALQALVGGDLNIATGAGAAAVVATARGADTVIIASSGFIPYKLISHTSITSLQGLRGKTVGVSNFAASDFFVLRRLLSKVGLVPDKDVTFLAVGLANPTEKIPLILQGRIDATLGTQVNVLQFELKGNKLAVLADAIENGIYEANAEVITTRQFLRNHRDLMKAFLKAFSEAIWSSKKDKEMAFRSFRKHLKVQDVRLLEGLYNDTVLNQLPNSPPYPTEESIRFAVENLSSISPDLKNLKAMKASDFMDLSPLREIEKEGFFVGLAR